MEVMYGDRTHRSQGSVIHSGIMLGCWDQENTSSLIRELEDTVNAAERKCSDLVQQIHIYRNYYEKTPKNKVNSTAIIKKSTKKSKPSSTLQVNAKKTHKRYWNKKFFERIKKKLKEVNKEISEANQKIGLQDKGFLFPTEGYKNDLHSSIILPECPRVSSEIESDGPECTQSDPDINWRRYDRPDVAHITKDELRLYKKLSSKFSFKNVTFQKKISRTKNVKKGDSIQERSRSLPESRVRSKSKSLPRSRLKCTRFTISNSETPYTIPFKKGTKPHKLRSKIRSAEVTKRSKRKCSGTRTTKSALLRGKSRSLDEPEEEDVCPIIRVHISESAASKGGKNASGSNNQPQCSTSSADIDDRNTPNSICSTMPESRNRDLYRTVIQVPHKQIPFTSCASTSRSFNIGMNIQHVMSLMKHRTPNLKFVPELWERGKRSKESLVNHFETATRCVSDTKTFKSQNRYRSLVPRDVNRLFLQKSISGTGVSYRVFQPVGTPMVHPRKSKKVESKEKADDIRSHCNGKGDDSKGELSEIHSDLVNLHSKYALLQNRVSKHRLQNIDAEMEIKALQSAIEAKEKQYKNFCSDFQSLREKLKELKRKYLIGSRSRSQQNKNFRRSRNSKSQTKLIR